MNMKNIIPNSMVIAAFAVALMVSTVPAAFAQQSCDDIIHVDGGSGSNAADCGGVGNPCSTINFGIQRAVAEGFGDVRITAANTYSEVVTLADGVSLWGGFDANWTVSGLTTIVGAFEGGQFQAVIANGINSPTVLSDLNIIAPSSFSVGLSSYGVHVVNSAGLTIQRSTIQGGNGAAGSNGSDAASATVGGVNGTAGGNADEFNTSCNSSSAGAGGTGGTLANPNTRGGNGGRGGFMDTSCSGFPNLNATSGVGGAAAAVSGAGFGQAGGGGATCLAGNDGLDGQTVHGAAGSGATTAANVVGNYWTATNATDGTIGQDGTGGGGGGGSGGCDDGTDSYGAGGGGGGSGGSAAPTPGTGGSSGGNSVAVFVVNSTITIINCQGNQGNGGNGGNGGAGGAGTPGGLGGPGGLASGDSQKGGDGGDGGAGGNSGAGGGGAGGSSYGIYAVNATINRSGTTFSGGAPGAPGAGGGGILAATAGASGDLVSVNVNGSVTDNVLALAPEPDPCVIISTSSLAEVAYCSGESATVDYTVVGSFGGTNTFTAELSDANGDFTTPTVIGSIAATASGTIAVQLPSVGTTGTAFRIRVVSSSAPATGADNGVDITIQALPAVVANASAASICTGEAVTLTGSGADAFVWDNSVTDGDAVTPSETTTYTVVGTDQTTTCENTASVTVTVIPVVDTTVVQTGNQLAAALAGASYQWVDCDNAYAAIDGETGQTYLAPVSGNFAVIVTQSGCSDTSSCYNTTIVGLEEVVADHVLLLYPNPSAGMFQFISDVEGTMDVSVVSMMGQEVFAKSNVTTNAVIDLQGLSNGMYSIRFFNRDVNLVRQIIIQK